MTYWVYKLTYDTGAAPHVRDSLLSLAICKPRIRKGAAVGDVIFGFSGRSRRTNGGERLIYVAEVTVKLTKPGEYYERPEFRDRWDCIYERVGESLVWRPGSLFHKDGSSAAKDIGPGPDHARAIVLLSREFRYLGADGTMDYVGRWPNLATFVHERGIGEREVEPESDMGRMLSALKRDLWRTRPAGQIGLPTEPESGQPSWSSTGGGRKSTTSSQSCSAHAKQPTRTDTASA